MNDFYKTRYFKFMPFQLVSALFNNILLLILPYWYYDLTHSRTNSSAILLTEVVVALIALPFIGLVVDNFSHKKITIITEITRASAVTGLIFIDVGSSFWLVFCLAGINSITSSLFFVLQQAIIKNNIDEKHIVLAQSFQSTTQGIALIAGPAFGAWLVSLIGYKYVFGLNSASYIISLLSLFFIKDSSSRKDNFSFLTDITVSCRYLWNNTILKKLFLVQLATYFAIGSLSILFIFFFKSHAFTLKQIAYMMAAQGAGVLIGSISPWNILNSKNIVYLGAGLGLLLIILAKITLLTPLSAGFILVLFGFLFVNMGIAIRTFILLQSNVTMIAKLSALLRLTTIFGIFSSCCFVVLSSHYLEPKTQLLILGTFLLVACLLIKLGGEDESDIS